MTEKRYNYVAGEGFHDYGAFLSPYVVEALLNDLSDENEQLKSDLQNIQDSLWTTEKIRELEKENEQLKQQKPFLKIIDDYFIQYEDGELFNLHKPSDIRSLMYILNRGNGYGELECEYNDLGKSDVE